MVGHRARLGETNFLSIGWAKHQVANFRTGVIFLRVPGERKQERGERSVRFTRDWRGAKNSHNHVISSNQLDSCVNIWEPEQHEQWCADR